MNSFRIYINKKTWLIVLCLFLVCIIHFAISQKITVKYNHSNSIARLKEDNFDAQSEYFVIYKDDIHAIESYHNDISVFASKGGYIEENRRKTKAAYKSMLNVKLTNGIDEFCESIVKDRFSVFCTLLMMLTIMISLLEERKNGLWSITFNCANGRNKLEQKRLLFLFSCCFLCNFVMFFSRVLYSALYYPIDKTEWTRTVQSISLFKNCVYAFSEAGFLAVFFACSTLSLFLISLFIWLMLRLFREINVALLVLVLLFLGELYLFSNIEAQSNISILKYINVWNYIFIDDILISYRNINLFSHAFHIAKVVRIVGIVVLPVMVFISLLISEKLHPIGSRTFFERVFLRFADYIKQCWYRLHYHCTKTVLELYKLLYIQKMSWFILLSVIIFLQFCSFQKDTYNAVQQFKFDYYEKYSGELKTQAYDYIIEKERYVKSLQSKFETAKTSYKNGLIELAQLQQEQELLDNNMIYLSAISELKEEYQFLKSLQASEPNVKIINQVIYKQIFGNKNSYLLSVLGYILFTGILLFYFDYFSYDNKNGIKEIIKATKNGRRKYVIDKTKAIIGSVLVYALIITSVWLISIWAQYEPKNLNAQIQCVQGFENYSMHITIGGILVIQVLYRIIASVVLALFISLVSECLGGIKGFFVGGAFVFIEEIIVHGLMEGRVVSLLDGLSGTFINLNPSVECMILTLMTWAITSIMGIVLINLHWSKHSE